MYACLCVYVSARMEKPHSPNATNFSFAGWLVFLSHNHINSTDKSVYLIRL